MSKIVVVNATALRSGGGLSILNQFVENIDDSQSYKYIIFVHSAFSAGDMANKKIQFIKVEKTNQLSRILWDSYGLNRWLKKQKVIPDLVISLQNTSIKTSVNCPQLIYLHQAIPFSDIKWLSLKPKEFKLFLYKYFYSYFIFLHAKKKSSFVVQTKWMKDALLKQRCTKNVDVSVIQPKIPKIRISEVSDVTLPKNQISIFYPAASLGYKNHIEIVNALIYLRDNMTAIELIKVYFTFDKEEAFDLCKVIDKNLLQNNFCFLGTLSFTEVLSYYKSVDLIVFPSYLESFGLPLIEAAEFGKPIVASDLSYAREVLNGYEGVQFAKIGNSSDWAAAINQMAIIKNQKYTYIPPKNAGWDIFFDIVKNKIEKDS